jgi:alpha-mannosidase
MRAAWPRHLCGHAADCQIIIQNGEHNDHVVLVPDACLPLTGSAPAEPVKGLAPTCGNPFPSPAHPLRVVTQTAERGALGFLLYSAPMTPEIELAARRFSVFAAQVLEPAIYPRTAPLEAAVYQCPNPITHDEALRQTFQPVEIGWRWGPVWSTAWFRLRGRVPADMTGHPVMLRFSSGTEALLWRDGEPAHGFDPYHETAVLFNPAQGNEPIELYVEGACNRPLGATLFWWDESEAHQRWSRSDPGELARCELTVYDPVVWRLWRTYDFARQFMLLLPDDSPRARQLLEGLNRATEQINDADVQASAPAAQELLESALHGRPATQTRCFAVGQAHMDTAWLWRIRETRRKCRRTFATALAMMEQYPDFRFLFSQAQQYAWIEEQSPALFAKVAARVREGRWEAAGAMWVEPDCNVPSGESLVRQILHGTRYWRRAFGGHGEQRFLYLPDTFGYSAAIPQIMALAGLRTFITNKLAWNDTNEFPYTNFRWRGLDGTEVLAHCTPGRDYNAKISPLELQRGEKEIARKDGAATGIWLQPFGYGDGGGGPTTDMIENALLAKQCEGLPNVTLATAGSFCDELHRRREALRTDGRDLPVWDGELYLEYHRGTYTTQAWLKRANRKAEQALRMAEWLTSAGPTTLDTPQAKDIANRLNEAWKLLLLNQFHDILPGSSITEVYEDARQDHARIRAISEKLIADAVARWSEQANTIGEREPMLVFNPCSSRRGGLVECDGHLHYVMDVPALGAAVLDRAHARKVDPVTVNGQTLSNGIITAAIDAEGHVVALQRCDSHRDVARRGPDGTRQPLNQLMLYDDRPKYWDAWDIDAEHEQKAFPVAGPAESWRVLENNPLRAIIEVSRPLGQASRIVQRFVMEAGACRLDIHTHVDWHESHRLLRALFPVDVHAHQAVYETQFGHVERVTHRNTSWERARFEVCAHRWVDLSEPGFGVALLNDCKYGHSCHDGVIGLTLLRSPKFPDPQADMGEHEFTCSLMPHDGDWRMAGVDREAEALNAPLIAVPLSPDRRGAVESKWAPFSIEADDAAGIEVSAVKRAEDDDRLIVRLVETHGGRGRAVIEWKLPVAEVETVDLLEQPLATEGFTHDPTHRRTTVLLKPFQIVSLAAK